MGKWLAVSYTHDSGKGKIEVEVLDGIDFETNTTPGTI